MTLCVCALPLQLALAEGFLPFEMALSAGSPAVIQAETIPVDTIADHYIATSSH